MSFSPNIRFFLRILETFVSTFFSSLVSMSSSGMISFSSITSFKFVFDVGGFSSPFGDLKAISSVSNGVLFGGDLLLLFICYKE